MKKIIWVALLSAIAGTILALSLSSTVTVNAQSVEVVKVKKVVTLSLSHEQKVWAGALEWCESKGVSTAVNEVDVDGTSSYGGLQFKPGTFIYYKKKYGLKGKLMDASVQEAIVEHMILDKSITPRTWRYQLFPDCVRKLGQHPTVIHT